MGLSVQGEFHTFFHRFITPLALSEWAAWFELVKVCFKKNEHKNENRKAVKLY